MKGDNPKGWRDFGTSGANCCRVKNCRCCSLKVEQRVRHLLHRLHQRVAKGSRYSYIPVMCVYNNWVIKLLILRLHFRLISGWRGNNPTREKMRTLVSLSYNMAKVVLIVEPERITLFPLIASLLYLLDENMRRDGVSPWRRSICYSSRGVEAYSSSSNSSRVLYYCDVDGRILLDCRALIGLLSLARTVHMTTVLCINRQKETHQQTLVPNGYCHFFLSIVHLSHQMYERISLGHHFPLKNPNLLGFKFEM